MRKNKYQQKHAKTVFPLVPQVNILAHRNGSSAEKRRLWNLTNDLSSQ